MKIFQNASKSTKHFLLFLVLIHTFFLPCMAEEYKDPDIHNTMEVYITRHQGESLSFYYADRILFLRHSLPNNNYRNYAKVLSPDEEKELFILLDTLTLEPEALIYEEGKYEVHLLYNNQQIKFVYCHAVDSTLDDLVTNILQLSPIDLP